MAMVAAVEFNHHVAACITPGKPDSAHGGLGARIDEPDFFQRGYRITDHFGQFHLKGSGGTETGAVRCGFADGLYHVGMTMTKDHRTPGADKVDELVAVNIGYHAAFRPGNKEGVTTYGFTGTDR